MLAAPIFHEIGETADGMGMEVYLVGGYVRDLFLQRPSKDIDCVVVSPPNPSPRSPEGESRYAVSPGIALARALKKKLGRRAHLSVFRTFGTAQLKVKNEERRI